MAEGVQMTPIRTALTAVITGAALLAASLPALSTDRPGRAAETSLETPAIIGAFAIDRTEVTVGAFRKFLEANGGKTAAERDGGGFEYTAGWTRRTGWNWSSPFGAPADPGEPAVHVTWREAGDFCAAKGGRLPTFEEWATAAYHEQRAKPTDGFESGEVYPYPVGERAEGMNTSSKRHRPVATTKRGVNGLYDMGANAWEWIADRRGDEAYTAGGSWWYGPEKTRRGGAQWKRADFYAVYIGFRCAYDRPANARKD